MEEEKKKRKNQKQFTCSWVQNWRAIHERNIFTLEEEGVLHRLSIYLGYQDNTIKVAGTNLAMSKKEIAEVLGISDRHVYRIIEGLKAKNAIIEERLGRGYRYSINPCLFWRGNEFDYRYLQAIEKFGLKKTQRIRVLCKQICPYLVRVNGRLISILSPGVHSNVSLCTFNDGKPCEFEMDMLHYHASVENEKWKKQAAKSRKTTKN